VDAGRDPHAHGLWGWLGLATTWGDGVTEP